MQATPDYDGVTVELLTHTPGSCPAMQAMIKMNMILVILVATRSNNGCEIAAGLPVNTAQKFTLPVPFGPIVLHGQHRPILKSERTDVNRICPPMLGELGPALVVARAAGIGCGHP